METSSCLCAIGKESGEESIVSVVFSRKVSNYTKTLQYKIKNKSETREFPNSLLEYFTLSTCSN